MSTPDMMAYDPAGALRAEHGRTWCIRLYPVAGEQHWMVRRWYPAPEAAAAYGVANAWEGECTASDLRAWLCQQDRAMGAWRGRT